MWRFELETYRRGAVYLDSDFTLELVYSTSGSAFVRFRIV